MSTPWAPFWAKCSPFDLSSFFGATLHFARHLPIFNCFSFSYQPGFTLPFLASDQGIEFKSLKAINFLILGNCFSRSFETCIFCQTNSSFPNLWAIKLADKTSVIVCCFWRFDPCTAVFGSVLGTNLKEGCSYLYVSLCSFLPYFYYKICSNIEIYCLQLISSHSPANELFLPLLM